VRANAATCLGHVARIHRNVGSRTRPTQVATSKGRCRGQAVDGGRLGRHPFLSRGSIISFAQPPGLIDEIRADWF
jgi:hypothetical protein